MKSVCKYNIFKIVSLILSIGTPLFTSILFSDFLVTTTNTSISTAGVIILLICVLIFKDKMLEELKTPTALKVCAVTLVFIFVIESIIIPLKWILIVTTIALTLDTLFIKRIYTNLEVDLPKNYIKYKYFGIIFCRTDKLTGETDNEQN